MSLLVLQHTPAEDAAQLGRVLSSHGHRLRVVRLDEGDALPPDLDDIDGLIVMGGPQNVDQVKVYEWLTDEIEFVKQAHAAGRPIVGVCLGAQIIATALGGKVEAMNEPEVGWHDVRSAFPGTIDTVLAGVPWKTTQFHLHGQQVTEPPAGAAVLAGSDACRVQAFKVGLRVYGFQYHFEWDRDELDLFCDDSIVRQSNVEPQSIRIQIDDHYDSYRRVGDRLCENIATYLFPIDKR